MEQWREVEDFPEYLVSNTGFVKNATTERLLKQAYNPQGARKVGLYDGTKQHTKSVKYLVACAFVDGRSDIFDTAMSLDGDQDNNHASNLVWRPRWFALQYGRQFANVGEWFLGRIVVDKQTGEYYEDCVDAAVHNGLLLRQVLESIHAEQGECFPTRQKFIFG